MRSYHERIEVDVDRRGTPARIVWRGYTFVVARVLDCWRYVGKWWLGQGGVVRIYYRIEVRPLFNGCRANRRMIGEPRAMQVFRQVTGCKTADKAADWMLSGVYD